MINIVHITENPIAGAPIALSNALNQYGNGRINSRHIASSDRNESRVFKSDVLIHEGNRELISKLIHVADIIHFHNFYQHQELFRRFPELWPVVLRKKRVWQVHSQRETAWVDLETPYSDKTMKRLVIAQYHPRQWPECEVVPNIVPIDDEDYKPLGIVNTPPRVVYTPSRIGLPGWDNKGYEETYPTLVKLVKEGKITANIVYNKTHTECMQIRQKADISIDEIVTGSYHLCSLESLSQGLATIAGIDATQYKTLRDFTGADYIPWVMAKPSNIEETLRYLISDSAELKYIRERSRLWMETYWHPKQHVERFLRIYENL